MKKVGILLIMIICISVVPYGGAETTAPPDKDWTIILYMGGDARPEAISDQIDTDLEDIRKQGVPEEINLIALVDQKGDNDSRALEISENTIEEIPLEDIDPSWSGELDMSSPDTLSTYLDWAMGNYNSTNTMLDLWGHGRSWGGLPLEDEDDLTLPEIDRALDGHRLDLIGFDACTMGLFETYYQLEDDSDLIVASESEEIMDGWPYARIMRALKNRPDMLPKEFAREIVDIFVRWGKDNSPVSTTLTAVDTGNLPVQALDGFIHELLSHTPYHMPEVQEARNETATYDPYSNPVDLYHFSQKVDEMVDSTRLRKSSRVLREGVNESVISHQFYSTEPKGPVENSHGLGIYYPVEDVSEDYSVLEFSELSWDEWLGEYTAPKAGENSPLHISINSSNKTDGLSYTLDFDQENYSASADVIEDGDIIFTDEGVEAGDTVQHDLDVGRYHLETSLFEDGDLVNHTRMEIIITSVFIIEGKISGVEDVNISVLNERTGQWRNTTVPQGEYELTLAQPGYCSPGDTLKITYDDGKHREVYTVEISRDPIEKDVKLGTKGDERYLSWWLLLINSLTLSMMGLTCIKRKMRRKTL